MEPSEDQDLRDRLADSAGDPAFDANAVFDALGPQLDGGARIRVASLATPVRVLIGVGVLGACGGSWLPDRACARTSTAAGSSR